LLDAPVLAVALVSLLGTPIEALLKLLPANWEKAVAEATEATLYKALEIAIHTLGTTETRESRERLHKGLVVLSGIGGGAGGLATLPVELPISTALILRSIADIARSEGHDISHLEVRLSCMEVLALGGKSTKDEGAETGYWMVRAALATEVREAVAYIARGGIPEKGAPALVRLLAAIASRFGVIVSEEVAAKAVPVAGAFAGGVINLLFMKHFQDMARGHFIVKRLERKHGHDRLRRAYEALRV
ncbi:MAG: EcsC family protein, partial [Acidobacteria bacterium]